jgi:pycsar effector protein
MSEVKSRSPTSHIVFPKDVHNLLVSAHAANITLSGMADTKASILMGASFVVFSVSIGDLSGGRASFAVVALTLFSFVATVLGVLTVRPTRFPRRSIPVEKVNLLFFASYTNVARDIYVEHLIAVLSSEEETYRRMAQDLYDHGKVLREDKFRWLYWSFTVFLIGMFVTAGAVVIQLIAHSTG